MLRICCVSFVLAVWFGSSVFGGVVVDDGEVRYSNFNDSGDEAFHGESGGLNLLGSDRWYLWMQTGTGLSQQTVVVNFNDLTPATDTGDSISWDVSLNQHQFNFSLDYSIDNGNVIGIGTLQYSADDSGTTIEVGSDVAIRLLNVFDYDVPVHVGNTDVTETNGSFVFADSADPTIFATRDQLSSYGGQTLTTTNDYASNVVLGLDGDPVLFPATLADGVNLDSNGAYQWSATFDEEDMVFTSFSVGTSSFAAVPEPSSLMYGTMVGLFALGRRRRRVAK